MEQFAKFELVINAQTARIIGIEISSTLLARDQKDGITRNEDDLPPPSRSVTQSAI